MVTVHTARPYTNEVFALDLVAEVRSHTEISVRDRTTGEKRRDKARVAWF